MTIRDRVVSMVTAWCGFGGYDTGTSLSVLWGKSSQASSLPFKPQAVMDLSSRLQTEFSSPGPDARDLSHWNQNAFAPGGSFDTVDDTVTGVMFAPVPAAAHAMVGGFANEAAKVEFVNSIADEVVRRLKPAAKPGKARKAKVKKASSK